MKKILFIFVVIHLLCGAQEERFPVLKGLYLGQPPPGIIPEIFAPGIISTDLSQGCSAFSSDGDFFIYNVRINGKSTIFEMKLINGIWTKPKISSINSEAYDGDFTFAPNRTILYFSSRRPSVKGGEVFERSNIWCTKYDNNGWSEPQILDYPINTDQHESYPSISNKGTLYFFANERNGFGKSDIFYSKYNDGKYSDLMNPGSKINTNEHEWDPYIDPDEQYMIFCSTKKGGYGEDDLYISFRNSDSTWSKAINMGNEINSKASENRPYISPDGKYLFFVSTKSGSRDIYWVDAKIIEDLKLKLSN